MRQESAWKPDGWLFYTTERAAFELLHKGFLTESCMAQDQPVAQWTHSKSYQKTKEDLEE